MPLSSVPAHSEHFINKCWLSLHKTYYVAALVFNAFGALSYTCEAGTNVTHFTDGNAEAQRRDVICSRSRVQELGFEFWKFDSRTQYS